MVRQVYRRQSKLSHAAVSAFAAALALQSRVDEAQEHVKAGLAMLPSLTVRCGTAPLLTATTPIYLCRSRTGYRRPAQGRGPGGVKR